jgi:selenocysteine-specific elongation factor
VALAKGDLFIVRTPSPSATIGGGTVVEPHPRRHRRHQAPVLERLAVLEQGTPDEIVLQQLQVREPTDFQTLAGRSGLSADETREVVARLVEAGDVVRLDSGRDPGARLVPTSYLASRVGWENLAETARSRLDEYHRAHRLRIGMPKEELRTRLGLDGRLYARVLERLVGEGRVREQGPLLALPDHRVTLSAEDQARVDGLVAALRESGASPPGRRELENYFGLSPDVTGALVERGDLVEVGDDLLYTPETLADVANKVTDAIRGHGPITVAGLRDLFGTSRRYALPLLAYLDERKITRRVGDERVLF